MGNTPSKLHDDYRFSEGRRCLGWRPPLWKSIQDALSDRFTMSELCARYGVSRRVGYKRLVRYEEEGRRGLSDRSRAPHDCPHPDRRRACGPHLFALTAAPLWGACSTSCSISQTRWLITTSVWRDRRRDLVHLLQRRTYCHPGRARLHHPWVTESATMLLDTCVTYVTGCSGELTLAR
jgi:hypothetical protein